MKIILISNRAEKARTLTLNSWAKGLLSVLLLGIPVAAGTMMGVKIADGRWELLFEILRNGSALPAAGNGRAIPGDGLGTFAWLDSAQFISVLCIEQSLGRSARKRRRGLCSSYSGQT